MGEYWNVKCEQRSVATPETSQTMSTKVRSIEENDVINGSYALEDDSSGIVATKENNLEMRTFSSKWLVPHDSSISSAASFLDCLLYIGRFRSCTFGVDHLTLNHVPDRFVS